MKWVYISIAVTLIGYGTGRLLEWYYQSEYYYHTQVANVQSQLQSLESKASNYLADIKADIQKNGSENIFKNTRQHQIESERKGIYLLVFDNENLVYWSDKRIALQNIQESFSDNSRLLRTRNGLFAVVRDSLAHHQLIGLILIQSDYNYQNKYIQNEMNPLLPLWPGAKVLTSESEGARAVVDSEGRFVFGVEAGLAPVANSTIPDKAFWFYVLSLLGLLMLIYFVGKAVVAHSPNVWISLLYLLIVLLVRIACSVFEVPEFLFSFQAFNPVHYASSTLLSSLGEMFINVLFVFYALSFLHKYIVISDKLQYASQSGKMAMSITLLVGYFFGTLEVTRLFHGLIVNSSISFNVNNLFGLDGYTVIGYTVIAMMLFSLFVLANSIVSLFLRLGNKAFYRSFFIALIIIVCAWIIAGTSGLFSNFDLMQYMWSIVFLLTIYQVNNSPYFRYSLISIIPVIILFSAFGGYGVVKYGKEKELNSRKLLAQRLDKEQDHTAEYLYEDIERKVNEDKLLQGLMRNPFQNASTIERRINQLYLTGYWNKYERNIYIFDSLATLYNNPGNDTISFNTIERKVLEFGTPTENERLFFMVNSTGRTGYIGFLKVAGSNSGRDIGTIVIELRSRLVQEEIGFPELLLSGRVSSNLDLTGYSYALYNNERLISQHGTFPFPLKATAFGPMPVEQAFVESDGYSHLIFKRNEMSRVVLSKELDKPLDYLTLFSYLFAIFYLYLLLFTLLRFVPLRFFHFQRFTFRNRIQLVMLSLVFLSLSLIGSGTIYYIIHTYNKQKVFQLSDKANATLVAVDNEMAGIDFAPANFNEDMAIRLGRLSSALSAEFIVYDTAGSQLFSSQPKIFDQGLVSRKMDPEAFYHMALARESRFIHNESIGKLSYLAAYVPVRDNENMVKGYLGLPYFAKESELKNEISNFLVALINVYLLLFIIAVALALLVADRLTQPLGVIRERMSKIRLGKKNEPIVWRTHDEIGELVDEYNRMVEELMRSAELLARSERESAWREMAKQVAHEIKNPLTPMKLSVQHLQRLMIADGGESDNKFDRITRTILEQIDALTTIANEFSNFAKMPRAQEAECDLVEIVQQVVNLYGQEDNTEVIYHPPAHTLPLMADKGLLARAFSNIIKNAIQAIPEERKGMISVKTTSVDGEVHTTVTDNGIGIEKEMRDKIFQPNFTTKSGGMGLGLSMVKSIIETAGGDIWFESDIEKGTVFHVMLPLHETYEARNSN